LLGERKSPVPNPIIGIEVPSFSLRLGTIVGAIDSKGIVQDSGL